VDAVDNVNADMLQLYTNYFRECYGVNKSEAQALAHISVLEAWSLNDNHYNDKTDGAALAMENKQRLALLFSLAKPIKDRTPAVSPLYNNTFNTTQRDFKTDWINKDGSTAYNEDEQLNSLQLVNTMRNTEMRQETTSLSVPMITTFKILLLKSLRKKSIKNQMVSLSLILK
ncbi:MAG: glycoside hydrolase family 70 protein, partial [Streptococcus salivarius]